MVYVEVVVIEATVRLNHPKQRNRWVDESPINVWLINNVGTYARFRDQVDESHPWHVDHQHGYLEYSFARGRDATAFSLRWA